MWKFSVLFPFHCKRSSQTPNEQGHPRGSQRPCSPESSLSALATFKASLVAAWQVVPGPCSHTVPLIQGYGGGRVAGILPFMGRQQRMGLLWSARHHASGTRSCTFTKHFFSRKTQPWLLHVQTPRPGLQGHLTNILYPSHSTLFFCDLLPQGQISLAGPGEFANAFPVSRRVILLMRVLPLLPIPNQNHLFQEALPDRHAQS